jgi:RNA polymerase sigma-70 factor (ECF subfamily)
MPLGDRFAMTLAAARGGDEAAWARLYRDLAPALLGYLRARRAALPEDLLGEVFVHMVTSLDSFQGEEHDFRAWAFTITRNRLVDSRRRSARRVLEVPVDPEPAVEAGDVETEAINRLGAQEIRELISRLSPDQQDVLLLRILGGLTLPEIAVALGKRLGAVKALQRRGLARLKKEISS